jgi:hypothetical protein
VRNVTMRGFSCAALMAVVCAGLAHADSGDPLARARTHFEAGRALYNLANYRDAIREFSAGYALAPRPQFLVNLGQAYRKLGEYDKARAWFVRYLAEAPADDPERAQAGQIVLELDRQLAEHPSSAASSAASSAPSSSEVAPPGEAQAPQPASPSLTVVTPAPPPARRASFARRHWWIFPTVAVVAAGVAVGIYFAVRPPSQVSCSEATLGCIDTLK